MKALLAAIAIVCAAVPAAATDIPFGGDALPYLIRTSDLTVRGRVAASPSAAFGPTHDRYLIHSVTVTSTVQGERLVQDRLNFGVHSGLPIEQRHAGEVLVFLKQLNGPTANALQAIARTQYVAVSGGHGVVDLGPAGRSDAVNALVAATDQPSRKAEWARRYLTSADMLLQRSSLHLAYDDIAEPWAAPLLLEAIGLPAVSLENRELAMEMLVDAEVPGTAEALRRLAGHASTPAFLRNSASRLLERMAAGERGRAGG